MSEIPDDILRAAEEVARACDDDHYFDLIRDAAVKALLSERKRWTENPHTPPPAENVMGSALRWICSPFDAYQHFTDDSRPYMIEFSRGSWRLTIGDRFLGNLVSLKAAKEAAEKDRAALSAPEAEG